MYIVSVYSEMTGTPEFKALMSAYGVSHDEINTAIDGLSNLRPIDIAFQFFTTNIVIGTIISFPIALTTRKRRQKQ